MRILFAMLLVISSLCMAEESGCRGKIDAGPVVLGIDMLEAGKTYRKLTLYGARFDASIVYMNGLLLKPSYLYASGDAEIHSLGLGVGFYYPATSTLCIAPMVGMSYTYFSSAFHYLDVVFCKEKIRSYGPFLGCDVSWTFRPSWRANASIQYIWSRVHTVVKPLLKDVGNSEGPSFGVSLEHDITPNWSVTVGGAYNSSLGAEKQGIRGKGVRIGLAYWF